jgi:hypothetical protein
LSDPNSRTKTDLKKIKFLMKNGETRCTIKKRFQGVYATMTNKRQKERIDVSFPVTVNTELKNLPSYPVLGRLENLSAEGMRISFPFAEDVLRSRKMSVTLKLPHPFRPIHTQGEIQWKKWDSERQRTTCGIRMAYLTGEHTQVLNEIIHEVKKGNPALQ